MSNPSPSDIPRNRGRRILEMLVSRKHDPAQPADAHEETEPIDTYRSLKQLKEMLKGGQITEMEYEEIKIELLTR